MTAKRVSIFLLVMSLIALFACTNPVIPGGDSISITGSVQSIKDYQALSNVKVSLNGESTKTDSSGNFSLSLFSVKARDLLLVEKDGFISYQNIIGTSPETKREFFLKPFDKVVTISPHTTNTVVSASGAKVTFPAFAPEDVNEDLVVSLTAFNVSSDDLDSIPGDFSAIDSIGAATQLISYGMIDVVITGKTSGEDYSLNDLGPFDIEIPMTGDPKTSPESIPLWYFDTAQNKWLQEGVNAVLDVSGKFYKGKVAHFSTWNADIKVANSCAIIGKIEDPYGTLGERYKITLSLDGYKKTFYQKESEFKIIRLPQDKVMTISVTKVSTGEIWSKEKRTHSSAADYDFGIFPEAGYLPNIMALGITKDIDEVTFNWTDPNHVDFQTVKISYTGAASGSNTIGKGVQTATFPSLPEGAYTFTFMSNYGGLTSETFSRKIYIFSDNNCLLTITAKNYDNGSILPNMEFSVDGTLYTGPTAYPTGTVLSLSTTANQNNLYFRYWVINGVQSTANPMTYPINTDNEIIAFFEWPK